MPASRSVALGFWIGSGTRDEPPDKGGISHFIEHLMFKGTARRSARDIAETFDSIGGDLNAFSAKEYVCYYARVIDQHVPLAMDVLTDMIEHSLFRPRDIGAERKVVLEEINMHEDAPADLVFDHFDRQLLSGGPLSRRVLGTTTSIRNITRRDILAFVRDNYNSHNIVVAGAGNLRHNDLVKLVRGRFENTEGKTSRTPAAELPATGSVAVYQRATQQAHICYGVEGLPVNHPDRFALAVMDIILGGGMSSRLFQHIREKRGLVYSVYTFNTQYSETGEMGVYAGTTPSRARQVIDLIVSEIDQMTAGGADKSEVDRAKEHLKGNMLLSLEDTTTRMTRLSRAEMYGSELLSMDDLAERIEAVTPDDVWRVAKDILKRPRVLTVIGPFAAGEFKSLGTVKVYKEKKTAVREGAR